MTDKSQNNQQQIDLDKPSFRRAIALFSSYIESLKNTFPLAIETIDTNYNRAKNNLNDFINSTSEIDTKSDNDKFQIKVSPQQLGEFIALNKEYLNFSIASSLLKRSFVVSLVSQFDAHLSRLIRTMFYAKPEKLNSSQKTLTFEELFNFSNLEAAKEYILEKEIETVLRKSHSDQFTWLEEKLGIKTLKKFPAWSTFIEITERRNLFVHCDGIISSQYMDVCKKNEVEIDKDYQVGKKLEVDDEYFNKACNCIFEVGIKLAHIMWRQLQPNEREESDTSINNICYDLIVNEEYSLANILLDFALSDEIKKHSKEQVKLMFLLNKAQALKWSGQEAASKKVLDRDWSAVGNEFKLAKSVLLNDFEEAKNIMLRIGNDKETIPKNAYKQWPLFKEFRKSHEFLETYEKIYEESFSELSEESLSTIQEAANNINKYVDNGQVNQELN